MEADMRTLTVEIKVCHETRPMPGALLAAVLLIFGLTLDLAAEKPRILYSRIAPTGMGGIR
jgi:hypothetical protein